jgi:hypothetical protein
VTITCMTVPGIGTNLVVTVFYNRIQLAIGQSTGVTSISYASPSLSSVQALDAGVTITTLPTVGNTFIELNGSNFGSSCFQTSAAMVSGVVTIPLTLVSCSSNTVVVRTSEGAGTSFVLSLTIAQQTTTWNGGVLAYAAPVITGLSGNVTLSTTGMYGSSGTAPVVTVHGANFGPGWAPVSVVYGGTPGGFAMTYTAVGCTRDASHAVITCFTVGGVGSGLVWRVTVAGQQSPPSSVSTSYPAPVLYDVTGVGAADADTQGGQVVSLIGLHFGPPSLLVAQPGIVTATYGQVC